jgi:branched-chain amino acid transport system ATP-binding protein
MRNASQPRCGIRALPCCARSALTEVAEEADHLRARVGLAAVRTKPAADLAHGQQRALEIAMTLASKPKLLLMDEPPAGMSPKETSALAQ